MSIDPFHFDLATLPWSLRGSFLSLAKRGGLNGQSTTVQDVYLISSFRPYGLPLFAISPCVSGEKLGSPSGFHTTDPVTTTYATPSLLQWLSNGTTVAEVVFQSPTCLRFRGTVPLVFDSDASVSGDAYIHSRPAFDGSPAKIEYVLTTMGGLTFVALRGKLSLINGDNQACLHRRVIAEGDEPGSEWEFLIYEAEVNDTVSTIGASLATIANSYKPDAALSSAKSESFDSVAQRNNKHFVAYANQSCPWASQQPDDHEKTASYINWSATVHARGKFTREAILMSKLWMNKLWSWDNCINAIALAIHDVGLALDQILLPFDYQAPDGRIPDCIHWLEMEWSYVKPPIQGWAVDKLLDKGIHIADEKLLQLYHGMARLTDFWMSRRRTYHSALPWYAHGNDSGWDNSTSFDAQPVIVSPDCAAWLIIQTDVLARLSAKLGLGQDEQWLQQKSNLTEALVKELWDTESGSFLVKNAMTGDTRISTSLLRLMPLAAAGHLPSQIVQKMVADLDRHLTEWGLATEEVESGLYEPDGYWRGPIWAPTTLLIESGLRKAGFVERADIISDRFILLCEKAGFAENYDAITGEGLRDLSYTWSASVFLVLKEEAAGRKTVP